MAIANASGRRPAGTRLGVEKHVYLGEVDAAKYLGFLDSSRRLKDLRQSGGGPRYVRIGSAVRYRSDWLDAWAEANAVSSTSEEAARRRA
jgi:hypothetical protein